MSEKPPSDDIEEQTQRAFEAYATAPTWKRNHPRLVPHWHDLDWRVQEAWRCAVRAIRENEE